ncbi:MAG: hypothetical protein V1702_00805 [Candidatus Woesearchaeota archaeon]
MTNKPTVSTRTMLSDKKKLQIIAALKNHPEGATPKTIAFDASINVNTVKSLLPKMHQVQKVPGLRGYYKLVDESGHDLLSWNFHNCILSCPLPDYKGEQIAETLSFGLVNYEFTVGAQSKKATLRVYTDHPLNVSSLCTCSAYLISLIGQYTRLHPAPSAIFVTTIEFNRDFKNLRLDWPRCITMDNLVDQFKLYQKKEGLRLEIKPKVPIEFETILAMLTKSTLSSDIHQAVRELVAANKALIDEQKKDRALLMALLGKILHEK